MKFIFLPLFISAVLIHQNLKAVQDFDAGIIFTDPVSEKNIILHKTMNSGAEAYTETAFKGDSSCLFIPQGKYAYFKAGDATITANDRNLIVKIIYFDEGFGTLSFQYNAVNGINYEQQNLRKTNSNTWISATFGITSASFRNAQNNQADFRINENNYIRGIFILKGALNPAEEKIPVTSGSAYSEFKDKSVAGYQAWFTATAASTGWVHWSANKRPEKGFSSFEIYPDVGEYEAGKLYQTGFADLGNREPSRLFSSADVIDTHFQWMKDAGIDGVALQRFIGETPYPVTGSSQSILMQVKKAAEKYAKIFYICYDMSSGKDENAWVESIKFDWVYNIEQTNNLTSSPAYATVNNKPVVQVWGPGFTSRVGNAAGTIELIKFLQSRGCYVIGGVPTNWRTESGDSKPGFLQAYKTYDMVSPWTPGRYNGIDGCNNHKNSYLVPDKNFCDLNHLDYLPVLFPGFAWSTWNNGTPNQIPREAGTFLWQQAYNIKTTGLSRMYFAMFDEYDEGTAIMKAATDWSMIPTDQYFLTLSADGIWVSSDFYLRVAGRATAMLKSPDFPSGTLTVPHSPGPVYYRNSFEKRFTSWVRNGVKGEGYQNLDPCFYNDILLSKNNVSSAVCEIIEDAANARNGSFFVKVTGTPYSTVTANLEYKIADVHIPVVEKLKLSFWKKTLNEPGRFVSVDLQFESGKQLSRLQAYTDQNGITMTPATGHGAIGTDYEQFICEIGKGELIGDNITAIIISYNHAASSGTYSAYFDDLLLTTDDSSGTTGTYLLPAKERRIYFDNNTIKFVDVPARSVVTVYSVSGVALKSFLFEGRQVPLHLPAGIYIITVKSENDLYTRKILIADI